MAHQLFPEQAEHFVDVLDTDKRNVSKVLDTQNGVGTLGATTEEEATEAVECLADPIDQQNIQRRRTEVRVEVAGHRHIAKRRATRPFRLTLLSDLPGPNIVQRLLPITTGGVDVACDRNAGTAAVHDRDAISLIV